jgi:hypothetical protein
MRFGLVMPQTGPREKSAGVPRLDRRKSPGSRRDGAPYLGRRPPINFGKDGVEAPKAAETGTHGDLRHR